MPEISLAIGGWYMDICSIISGYAICKMKMLVSASGKRSYQAETWRIKKIAFNFGFFKAALFCIAGMGKFFGKLVAKQSTAQLLYR